VLRQQMPGSIAGEVVKLVAGQLADKLGQIQPNPPLEPAAARAASAGAGDQLSAEYGLRAATRCYC
jgi:hypothetical protein